MTTALYVTLGHNSSAVLAQHGSVVAGYEQERLDRKKSSSSYPREAIERCANFAADIDVAYVSHWFDDCNLNSNKYLDLDHLRWYTDEIIGVNQGFTHHDAHAGSAIGFYRSASGREFDDADIIVCDGFGTRRECLSVYRYHGVPGGLPKLVHRTYGYELSLGLMYQYTTAWLGLKQNQDEYKLLGYEAHVLEYTTAMQARNVREIVIEQASRHVEAMLSPNARELPYAGVGDLFAKKELERAKGLWFERCQQWRNLFPESMSDHGIKACVAFCAQTFIEECMVRLIEQLCPEPMGKPCPVLILTGGCFYNVKLNRRLVTELGRRTFPHPLAGDQGAALGFTPHLHQNHPCWGDRIILGRDGQLPVGVEVWDGHMWAERAAKLIEENRIVNVVRGGMEFGPRALCNTTTLARPWAENVRIINGLNERDEAMPMAPVITASGAYTAFDRSDHDRQIYATRFMITTCAFKNKPPTELMGVAHKDPLDEVWTARPQIVNDYSDLGKLLSRFPHEALINTSFNYHGEPIVYSEDDACKTHSMQCFRAQQLGHQEPITILVRS